MKSCATPSPTDTPPSSDPVLSQPPRRQPFHFTPEQRAALASLKLATYAIDAMRVLNCIELHASRSRDFTEAVGAACPDWRNPGWCEDPADLLVSVMTYATDTIDNLMRELDKRSLDEPAQ